MIVLLQKNELLLLCKDVNNYGFCIAQQKKDGIAGFIPETIASSEIGNIPEESKTLNTEESGSNGTPKRSLSVPSGQPEKVIRTGKRQSKREGTGKGRVKKKDIRRF